MEKGIYASTIIILTLILLGIFVSFLTGILLVPLVSTPAKIRREILDLMNIKEGQIILDLGSGNGSFLIEAAQTYGIMGVGYEISPVGIIVARIMKIFKLGVKNNIAIVPSNFLTKAPLPIADKIYCYLNAKAMETIEKKLNEEELDENTEIFSYQHIFPNTKAKKEIELSDGNKLYIYNGKSFTK